jgi:hypothetical protein
MKLLTAMCGCSIKNCIFEYAVPSDAQLPQQGVEGATAARHQRGLEGDSGVVR